jgi:outer membrane immunogenic protein
MVLDDLMIARRHRMRSDRAGGNTMKKFLLGTVGLVALGVVTPASAADLAARPYTKAPPPIVAPIYNWGGFYIGANGGYGWSNQCIDITSVNGLPNVFAEGCRNAGGGVAGAQLGYRWQAASWVFGLEAQGDWAKIRTSRTSLLFPADTWRSQINGLGLFTGQVGYAWDAALFYVKGGAAVANQRYDLFNTLTGLDWPRQNGHVGAGRLVLALSTASRRIGAPASNTTIFGGLAIAIRS